MGAGLPHIGADILHRGDLRRWLGGQQEAQLGEEKLLFGVGFGAAAQEQFAAVGGGQVHVDRLDAAKVAEGLARGQARGVAAEFFTQGDVDAVRQETHHDVGLVAAVFLVEDGAQAEVALEVHEGLCGRRSESRIDWAV